MLLQALRKWKKVIKAGSETLKKGWEKGSLRKIEKDWEKAK